MQIENRHIRVFISSTFRDMMRERDLLVKRIFPELRSKCAKRFVTFTEVDLRWGITKEQAAEGQVLPLCLEEIARCRPYFISLLGERYGWIPDAIKPDLIEREPWLKNHVTGRTSVTELEILHGVLNDPDMNILAFFYFRDPTYINDSSLSPKERRDMIEHNIPSDVEKYGEAEATRRTRERKAKLAALKQRIRDSKIPLVESYANPEALAEIVRKQFDELIDRLYPEVQVPNLIVQERMTHEAHAKNKIFACIKRPIHIKTLNDFANCREARVGIGLVVTGESGGGKSSLLAGWAHDWAASHPGDFLFQHYFGATPHGASVEGFLRRLLGELKIHFDMTDEIPGDLEKLREVLPIWLAKTIDKGRIVLVLDGLNQIQGSEADRPLNFLPRYFPPHVTALASTLPSAALDTLRESGWAEYELPRPSEAEVDEMVSLYLRIHARTLESDLHNQLVTAPGAKNPLFLRTILEELRQFGSFESLPERVEYYLEADNPKDLLLRVLSRWQEDFSGKDPTENLTFDLVRRTLTYLLVSRQGLTESEWLELLGMEKVRSSETEGSASLIRTPPLPRILWTPLFFSLEPHLSQHAGLYVFGHDFLRQAVEEAFLPEESQRSAHLMLAEYFEHHVSQQEITLRNASELPYQLHAAEEWIRLESCLTNIHIFKSFFKLRKLIELTGYWLSLRGKGREMEECYTNAFQRWIKSSTNAQDLKLPAYLGAFLHINGMYSAAESFFRRALKNCEKARGLDDIDSLKSLRELAGLLLDKGDYLEAKQLFIRALEVFKRALWPNHPDTLITEEYLAILESKIGDLPAAKARLLHVLDCHERVLGPNHPSTLGTACNLASLLDLLGESNHAELLLRRSHKGLVEVLGPYHPDTLIAEEKLAILESKKGALPAAKARLLHVLDCYKRALGPNHPSTLGTANNLACLLLNKEDHAAAEPLFRRALEGFERELRPDHPDVLACVNNLAFLLLNKEDHAAAEPLFRRALEGFERELRPDHPNTLECMHNLAILLEKKGDYAATESLFLRVLDGFERMRVRGPKYLNILKRLNNLASILAKEGNLAAAEPLFRRVLECRERVPGHDHPDTLASVNNLAFLLEKKGNYAAAEPLYLRALKGIFKISATHPYLEIIKNNYKECMIKLGRGSREVQKALEDISPFSMNNNLRLNSDANRKYRTWNGETDNEC